MRQHELANAVSAQSSAVVRNAAQVEGADAQGHYKLHATGPVEAFRAEYVRLRDYIAKVQKRFPIVWRIAAAGAIARMKAIPMETKWVDEIHNVVCTEGKNAALSHFLKGSTYTATCFLGLIESTGYGFAGANGSGVAATNLAGSITAAGGASPANGWNECPSSAVAARGTPSFGTASAGALALSSAVSFSILATVTIRGCFLIIRSAAGVASVATVGSTAGSLYSAGLFSGGDRTLANGDTLNVSYSSSL
jgi:hypothetical protein